MHELYDTSMADFRAVHDEREKVVAALGVPASPTTVPRDLLVRWRQALSHVRLLRSIKRSQGGEPPALPAELTWIDDRWFELKLDGDGDYTFYWLQTAAPEGSPTA